VFIQIGVTIQEITVSIEQYTDTDCISIIVDDISQAGLIIHKYDMWNKGYRLASNIMPHRIVHSDGKNLEAVYDEPKYLVTFQKR